LAPKEKNLKWWAHFVYVEDSREYVLLFLEVDTINLVICSFMGCCQFVANKDKETYIEPLFRPSLGFLGLKMHIASKFSTFLS
jgi:hypothetical protein